MMPAPLDTEDLLPEPVRRRLQQMIADGHSGTFSVSLNRGHIEAFRWEVLERVERPQQSSR